MMLHRLLCNDDNEIAKKPGDLILIMGLMLKLNLHRSFT